MAPLTSVITPNQTDALTALRSFLLAVLPTGVEAVIAIENRVPQVIEPNCCIMSPIRFQRLETNVSAYQDVKFTASIAPAPAVFSGSIAPTPAISGVQSSGRLTVVEISSGVLLVGAVLSGPKVVAGTMITSQISGPPGGAGVYTVSISQVTPATTIAQAVGLMTVSAIDARFGPILNGALVFGVDVLDDTRVTALGTGSGGTGTYAVSRSQTVAGETMSSGVRILMMNSRMTVQLDFHSIDGSSADTAQTVATAFRDQFAVDIFTALPPPMNQVKPFYADDPKLLPYQNENQQYEWRWVVEANMQVNQTITVPQQFADSVVVQTVDVPAEYPAG